MKYWLITTRNETLGYYAFAPTNARAVQAVEALTGPLDRLGPVVKELPGCPEGYRPPETGDQILEASDGD